MKLFLLKNTGKLKVMSISYELTVFIKHFDIVIVYNDLFNKTRRDQMEFSSLLELLLRLYEWCNRFIHIYYNIMWSY